MTPTSAAGHLPEPRRQGAARPEAAAAPAARDDAAAARPLPRLRRARAGEALGRGHAPRRPRPGRARPRVGFFTPAEAATLNAFCDVLLAQDEEPRIASSTSRREARERRARRLPVLRHARRRRHLAARRARARRGGRGAATTFGCAPARAGRDLRPLRRRAAARGRLGAAERRPRLVASSSATRSRRSTRTPGHGTRSASAAPPTRAATPASAARSSRAASARLGGARRSRSTRSATCASGG